MLKIVSRLIEALKDFLLGRPKEYKVATVSAVSTIMGRNYKIDKKGRLTIYSGFDKIATFPEFKYIIENG